MFSTPPTILAAPEPAPKAFSNARLAVSPPHEELALIVSDCPRLSVEGDIATGVLSETAARLLLAPDNDLATAPLAAEGTFRLVLREGRVVRYKLLLRGIVAPTRKKTFLITQTSETTVRDIGRTTLEIPAEVRLRLGD